LPYVITGGRCQNDAGQQLYRSDILLRCHSVKHEGEVQMRNMSHVNKYHIRKVHHHRGKDWCQSRDSNFLSV